MYTAPEERLEDWDSLIKTIEDTAGVSVTTQEDGGIQVRRDKPSED
ncbi:DUF1654 domain-containing protein [Pseudomonas putida]